MGRKAKVKGKEVLNASQLKSLAVGTNHADGGGLFLFKSNPKSGSWYYIYLNEEKKRKQMSLGKWPDLPLSEARNVLRAAQEARAIGIDPLAAKKQNATKKNDKSNETISFDAFFKDWFENVKYHSLVSEISRKQWPNTINTYCKPILDLPLDKVTSEAIVKCLEPIWNTKKETAAKLRGRIEETLRAAMGRGIIPKGNNPAAYKGCLDAWLSEQNHKPKRHDALDYRLIPKFMKALREKEQLSARALEFIILNANRLSEGTSAKWGELDLIDNVWTIPEVRLKVKNNGDHRIPLSNRSLEIIEEIASLHQATPKDLIKKFPDRLIFENIGGNSYSSTTMEKLVKNIIPPITEKHATPHGMRSSFRTWGFEKGIGDFEIMEVCLAHKIPGVSDRYQVGEGIERRRIIMQKWADYCQSESK